MKEQKERKYPWRELKKLEPEVKQAFRKRGDQIEIHRDGTIWYIPLIQEPERVGKLKRG